MVLSVVVSIFFCTFAASNNLNIKIMSKKEIKFEVIPHYVDEILVDDRKAHKLLINKANSTLIEYAMGGQYSFNEDGECSIEMEFYDGIALATDGSGLYMTYPTLAEVAKSPIRQEKIQDYTGVYDGTINQHDVALRYGVLKFDEKRQKISTNIKIQAYEHETLVLMSADIYNEIYNMAYVETYNQAAEIVRNAALKFERELAWAGEEFEQRDFIEELEKFEKKELERLKKIYDCE